MTRALRNVTIVFYFSFLCLRGNVARPAPSFIGKANGLSREGGQDILEDHLINFPPPEFDFLPWSGDNFAGNRYASRQFSSRPHAEISTPSDTTESSSVTSGLGLPHHHSESSNTAFSQGSVYPSQKTRQLESGDIVHDTIWAPWSTSPPYEQVDANHNSWSHTFGNEYLADTAFSGDLSTVPPSNFQAARTTLNTEPHGSPSSAEIDSVLSFDHLSMVLNKLPSFGNHNMYIEHDFQSEPHIERPDEAMPTIPTSLTLAQELSKDKRKGEDFPIQPSAGKKSKSDLSPPAAALHRQLQNHFALYLTKFDKQKPKLKREHGLFRAGQLVQQAMISTKNEISLLSHQWSSYSLEKMIKNPELAIGYFGPVNEATRTRLVWLLDSTGQVRDPETVMKLMESLFKSATFCHLALFKYLNIKKKYYHDNHLQFLKWLLEQVLHPKLPILGIVPYTQLNKQYGNVQALLIDYFFNEKQDPFDPFTTSVSLLGNWYQTYRVNVWDQKFGSEKKFVHEMVKFGVQLSDSPHAISELEFL